MPFAEIGLFLQQLVPEVKRRINLPPVITIQRLLMLSLKTPSQPASALFAKTRGSGNLRLTDRTGDVQPAAYFDTSTASAAAPL